MISGDWINSGKGDNITCSLHGGFIHDITVLLKDKRYKPSPGAIMMDVKFWDMFKEIINQGKVIFYWYPFLINVPGLHMSCSVFHGS